MKTNFFNMAGCALVALVLASSCSKKEEYVMPELPPVVSFNQEQQQVNAQNYIASGVSDVEVGLSLMRVKEGGSVSFKLERVAQPTKAIEEAFVLVTEPITVSPAESITQKVGIINWSALKPGESFEVQVRIVADESVYSGPAAGLITLKFTKPVAPLIWLDKDDVYEAIIPAGFDGESKVISVTIPVTSDEVLEDIIMPISLNQYNATLDVHFRMSDPTVRIAKGQKTATLQIEVIKGAFAPGEVKRLWIEMHSDEMPSGVLARVDDTYWWTAIDLGVAN